jgi:hypothetical protein
MVSGEKLTPQGVARAEKHGFWANGRGLAPFIGMTQTLSKAVDLRVSPVARAAASPKTLAWLLIAVSVAVPCAYGLVHVASAAVAKSVAGAFAIGFLGAWGILQIQSLRLWWRARKRLVWLPLTLFLTGVVGQLIFGVVWFALSFELNLDFGDSGAAWNFGWTGC